MSLILSEHFRLAEFTTSLVAITQRIDNTPPLPAICNLQQLCLHVLEPLRAHLGHAVQGPGLLDTRRLPRRGAQPPAGDRPPREAITKWWFVRDFEQHTKWCKYQLAMSRT